MDQLIQSLGNCLNIYIKQKGNLNSNTQQQQQVDTDDITIGYENKRQINDSQHFEMKIKRHNIFIVTMYHIVNDTIVLGLEKHLLYEYSTMNHGDKFGYTTTYAY
eukprot:461521_1